jgi:hypothetical protein
VYCGQILCVSDIDTSPQIPRIGGSLWHDFSVSLGLNGLVMMVLKFILIASSQRLQAPYGSDLGYHFHRPNFFLFQWVEPPKLPTVIKKLTPINTVIL